jgi:hypothetical protein
MVQTYSYKTSVTKLATVIRSKNETHKFKNITGGIQHYANTKEKDWTENKPVTQLES